ncbi:MAG: hypothetical protein LBQ54_07765 [Planctomycetaceae bacterium]|nr:hypothetical protein [Planctomycetaceae bacterium]
MEIFLQLMPTTPKVSGGSMLLHRTSQAVGVVVPLVDSSEQRERVIVSGR